MHNNPFTLAKDHKHYLSPEFRDAQEARIRKATARSLWSYRRHAPKQNLPRIKLDRDHDHYLFESVSGPVYLNPVFHAPPGIGSFRCLSILWRASIGITHAATRWHPEEADEVDLCDGRSLIEAVFCASALVVLESLNSRINDDEMCAQYTQDKELLTV